LSLKDRLTPFLAKDGFALYESISSRSLVRMGSKVAGEYGVSFLLEENASKGKIYRIDDSKYALDLYPVEPFSRLKVGDQTIRRVLHQGNIYNNWVFFTDKTENIAVLEFQTNNKKFRVPIYVRSPEYLQTEGVLQFRLRLANKNDLPKSLIVLTGLLDSISPVEFSSSKLLVVP
jgi:hypothetical protein